MTALFLIRHAANDFVKEGKMAGWLPDVHLNDEGRQQAEQMAARMDKVVLDAIYSSPLERAVETAEYLARPRGLEIQQRERLGRDSRRRVGRAKDRGLEQDGRVANVPGLSQRHAPARRRNRAADANARRG